MSVRPVAATAAPPAAPERDPLEDLVARQQLAQLPVLFGERAPAPNAQGDPVKVGVSEVVDQGRQVLVGGFTSVESVWCAEQMAPLRRPFTRREIRRSRRLLQSLMRWIAGYERWVEETRGPQYRARTLAAWNRTAIPADRMAVEWELLARHVEEPPP